MRVCVRLHARVCACVSALVFAFVIVIVFACEYLLPSLVHKELEKKRILHSPEYDIVLPCPVLPMRLRVGMSSCPSVHPSSCRWGSQSCATLACTASPRSTS